MREIPSIRICIAAAALLLSWTAGGCASAKNAEMRHEPTSATSNVENSSSRLPSDSSSPAEPASPSETASALDPPTPANRPAVTEPPTLGELPNLKPLTKRSISVRVEAEGAYKLGKRRIVPEFGEIPLTEEEKKALGKDKPQRPDDVTAFYKPSPNPDKGASTLESDLRIGIGGQGGALVGQSMPHTKANVHGTAGRYAEPIGVTRKGASVYDARDIRWQVSFPWMPQIEEGPVRKGAEQTPVEDR